MSLPQRQLVRPERRGLDQLIPSRATVMALFRSSEKKRVENEGQFSTLLPAASDQRMKRVSALSTCSFSFLMRFLLFAQASFSCSPLFN